MNLHHLRTFVAVWRSGSISKAAETLGIAQPAASAQIRSLETELGKPLFTRHARGVRSTPVADELARTIGGRLDGAEAAFERLRARSSLLEGIVHVAGPAEFVGARMLGIFTSLLDTGIDVRARLGGRDAIYAWLERGEIDLAITASEPADPALGHEVVFTERLLLVASPKLGLAGDPATAWPWLAYDEDLPLIRVLLRDLDPTLLSSASIRLTVPSLTLLRDLAIAGAGVTVMPDYLCRDALAEGRLSRVNPDLPVPANDLRLVWRREAMRHPRVVFARDRIRTELRALIQ